MYYSGGDYYDGASYQMAVSKSTSGGSTWTRSILTTTGGFTYALAVDPSNSSIVYAGGNPGLFKSTNAGSNWALSSTGLSGTVRAIAVNPVNCNVLYAGTDAGLFKSTNSGGNWTDCGLDYVQAVMVHPTAPETVFAGTTTGVYRSANSGGSWTAMNAGLDNLDVSSLGINPGYYLFCGTRGCGMYSSSLAIGVEEQGRQGAGAFMLKVYPIPATHKVTIRYMIPDARYRIIGIKIFDASGRLVKFFDHESYIMDRASDVTWDGTDAIGKKVPAGIYFCRLEGTGVTVMEKLVFLR